MADELEELFVEQVSVGVADMDLATEDDVISTRVVVQRTTASDAKSGENRELLLVYGAEEVPAVAEALNKASERAKSTP
jgi:hypothetical protein